MDYLLSLTDVWASSMLLIVITFMVLWSGVSGFVRYALLLGVGVRVLYIAVVWTAGVPLLIEWDCYDFLREGNHLAGDHDFFASFDFGSQSYRWFLGRLFNLLGYAPMTASMLSVFAWTASVLVMIDIWRHARGGMISASVILILSLLPFHVFLTSSVMREAWQTLGILMFARFLMEIAECGRLHLPSVIHGVIGSIIMGATHYALLAAMPIIIGTIFLARGIMRSKGSAIFFVWCLALICSLAGVLFAYSTYAGDMSEAVSLEYGIRQRDFGNLTYTIPIEATPEMMPLYASFAFIRFYLGPWPWDVGSFEALYVMLEGWGRSLLLFFAISNFRQATENERIKLLVILVSIIVISAIWAIGTYNSGTATRHAATVFPLLLVCGWLIRSQKPKEGQSS